MPWTARKDADLPEMRPSWTGDLRRDLILNDLRDSVNREYGLLDGNPRIDQGPCGAFAVVFQEEWNRRFVEPVSLILVVSSERTEAFHALVRLPDGRIYDGGHGLIAPEVLPGLLLGDEMIGLPESPSSAVAVLEEHFGPLTRYYPRCPEFSLKRIRELISSHLDRMTLRGS